MREKNKQTNNSQLFQEKNIFNNITSIFFKKILTYKNIATAILLIAIFIASILVLTNDSFAAFTAQEMEEFQNNEMISGMCYVYKIMTSNLTKAIAAAFVMGSGWLFFLGGIKDWKPILSLSIAITLIFGGFEIANLISRNDYTCNKIAEEAEKNKNTPTEKTTFTIVEIEAYSQGQEWKICDKNTNLNFANCEIIDENDEISIDDDRDLVLFKCQSGYFKTNEDEYLKYNYNKETKKFNLLSGNSDGSIPEDIKCKPTCKISKLISLLEVYHSKSTLENNKFQILDNSGQLKDDDYYTSGTKINLDCLPEYEEYDENNELNKSGLIAICNNNGEFEFKGSCKGKCYLDKYINRDTFTEWQKYNQKTNTWANSTDNIFLYGDKVRIKTCNAAEGYLFNENSTIPDDEKLVLLCDSIGNSESWIPQSGGKSCTKFCRLSEYKYYREHIWKKGCTIEGCKVSLAQNEDLFEAGTTLGISGCTDNSYNLASTEGTLRITCNDSRKWEENGGKKCLGTCDLSAIKSYDYADDWELCVESNCRTVKYENIGKINDGNTLQQKTCKTGYSLNGTGTIFECKNGIFERKSGYYDEVCTIGCNEASPVFDVDNLKVADKMYGITFASNNTNSNIHTYQVCYKNSNTNNLFTLNTNGTGLNFVKINEHVNCSYDKNNLKSYYKTKGRILDCKQDNNINNGKPYWQSIVKSCDLNELKNYSGISVKLAYGGYGANYIKDINTIMTSGSKQVRFLPYHNNTTTIDLNWSKPYATLKLVEGNSITGNATIICNNNGTWDVTSAGTIEYDYTGNVQTFTPAKYGASKESLRLEVGGAPGSNSSSPKAGFGGITIGSNYKMTTDQLSIFVGGTGIGAYNGAVVNAYNGGGSANGTASGGGGRSNINAGNNLLVVAGGGGGGSGGTPPHSGYGGDGGGGNQAGTNGGGSCGGKAGTTTAVGAGGTCNGKTSGSGNGSYGGNNTAGCCGGGGGGGYYGGGAGGGDNYGGNTGGGGGSGYCNITLMSCSGTTGGNKDIINGKDIAKNGYAKISWSAKISGEGDF